MASSETAAESLLGADRALASSGELGKAGEHWSRAAEAGVAGTAWWTVPRSAWWTDPPTLRHINRLVCGEPIEGLHAGFHRRLAALLNAQCSAPARAISVGSGTGTKELGLILAGVVGSFDCFDIAAAAVETGRRIAADYGVAERLRFHHADAFAVSFQEPYDLVYWNNALHHMFDTAAAVAWSRERLRDGGVFALDDYVGANRFQYSDELLTWVNRILALLPDGLLRVSDDEAGPPPRLVGRIPADHSVFTEDPTEAADSANILPAIARTFPDAEVIRTGGALYYGGFNRTAGLNHVFRNFRSWEELQLLDALLLIDQAVGQYVETLYAAVLAVNEEPDSTTAVRTEQRIRSLPSFVGSGAGESAKLRERIRALERELTEDGRLIADSHRRIQQLETENAILRTSTSWRLTAPLRVLGRLIIGKR